jgi:hypothetical protein
MFKRISWSNRFMLNKKLDTTDSYSRRDLEAMDPYSARD